VTTLPAQLIDLGRRDFAETLTMQRDLCAARQRDEIPDTLLLVEHPHVITLGRGTHKENLLNTEGVPVYEVERGGDVTYHGPGQLVGYPVVLLRPGERDLHRYLRNLEEAIIRALAELGLSTGRRESWTGVWIGNAKLASIGVAVKKWVTLHGFALNVSTDLRMFGTINPCGLQANVMTSVAAALGREVTIAEVAPLVAQHLGEIMGRAFEIAAA
jgi:lipoate-protein ligase B